LVEEISKNNNQISIKVDSANALGEQMRKYSKQVFPRMHSFISPYTYRHAFAKNIKSGLFSTVDIALAMGHSNDKSQRYYANKGKDGGGFKIEQIEGSREVKQISQNSGFNPGMLTNDNGMRM
jgi:integrase